MYCVSITNTAELLSPILDADVEGVSGHNDEGLTAGVVAMTRLNAKERGAVEVVC